MPGTNRASTSPDCVAETPELDGWRGNAVLQMLARTEFADVTGHCRSRYSCRSECLRSVESSVPGTRPQPRVSFCLSCGAELPWEMLTFPHDRTGHEKAHFPSKAFLTFFCATISQFLRIPSELPFPRAPFCCPRY